jgi:hypothetical protein
MSGRSSAVMFIFLVAIALAANQADHFKPMSPTGRKPALEHVEQEHTYTRKIHGPLSAMVELIGAAPEKAGDVFVLRGLIRSEEILSNVNFKWALPKGVELINGEASGLVSFVQPGQEFPIQLTLRSLTDRNAQVHLVVHGGDRGRKFGDAAQYNTLVQPMLDNNRKVQKEFMKSRLPSAKEKSTHASDLDVFQ